MPSFCKTFPFILVAILLAVAPVFAQNASLKDIIERHVKALGGKEAISKVDNLERKAKVTLEGGFGSMSGTGREIVDIKGKRYYNDLDLGQYKKTQAMAGDGGWFKGTEGDGAMGAQEIAFAKMSLGVSPLLSAYETAKGALKVNGTKKIGGNECHVVAIGSDIQYFVDTKSSLLEGMNIAGLGAISLSNYKKVDGVQFPVIQSMNIEAQAITIKYTFRSTKINVEIDTTLFGDLAESKDSESPEYTAEQIMGFMDTDADEKISQDEAGGLIKQNFGAIDTNGDGFIDMSETDAMLAFAAQRKNAKSNKAKPESDSLTSKQLIASMDKDKDGKVSKREASEELKPFFGDTDTNNDGFIDEKEGQALADFVNENR